MISMSFREGKVIDRFFAEKNGKKIEIIFRFPEKSDAKDMMKYINSLVAEKAFIGRQKSKKKELMAIVVEIEDKAVSIAEIRRKTHDANRHVTTIGIGLDKKYRGLGDVGKIPRGAKVAGKYYDDIIMVLEQ